MRRDNKFRKGGVLLAELRAIATKLQKALAMNGRYITINQVQIYSNQMQRICTKYILKELHQRGEKTKYFVVYDSFRMIDIVNYLAARR